MILPRNSVESTTFSLFSPRNYSLYSWSWYQHTEQCHHVMTNRSRSFTYKINTWDPWETPYFKTTLIESFPATYKYWNQRYTTNAILLQNYKQHREIHSVESLGKVPKCLWKWMSKTFSYEIHQLCHCIHCGPTLSKTKLIGW